MIDNNYRFENSRHPTSEQINISHFFTCGERMKFSKAMVLWRVIGSRQWKREVVHMQLFVPWLLAAAPDPKIRGI